MYMPDFEIYQSPFSWRYGSRSMRRLWSETNKRLIWRKIWVVLAEVQAGFGLVTQEQVADLTSRMNDIDLPRSIEIETEIQHDLMAELKTFAEQCPLGGGILHLGATSTDIEDNTDVIRQQAGLDLILGELKSLLLRLCQLIEAWAETPTMAYTHLQPAEPSTLGYRFAFYAQDLLADYSTIKEIRKDLKGKGFKGAVGTRASFADLVGLERLDQFESQISTKLGLKFFPITSKPTPAGKTFWLSAAWLVWVPPFIKWLLICAFCKPPRSVNCVNLSLKNKWGPPQCHLKGIPSALKRSTPSDATWLNSLEWLGITLPIPFSSGHWMILPIAGSCYLKRSWLWKNC